MRKAQTGIILSVTTLLVFAFCARVESPYLNNYEGEYIVHAEWILPPDSFFVFTPYVLRFLSIGTDSFQNFRLQTEPSGFLDTNLLNKTMNDSQVTVIFTRPFKGLVKVIGIRQNKREDVYALSVKVQNPFKLQGTKSVLIEDTVTVTISRTAEKAHIAEWYIDSVFSGVKNAEDAFIISCDSVRKFTLYAFIKDTLGNSISTDTALIEFRARTPVAAFPRKDYQLPVGQEISIAIQTTNCDSVLWEVKRMGLQVTRVGPLKTTFTEAGPDTVIITGINKYEAGTPDTMYVTASVFTYTLKVAEEQFPDTISARYWAQWRVFATRNDTTVTDSLVSYEWSVTPDTVYDSLRLGDNGSLMQLLVNDSVAPFFLSVRAKIGSDSTYLLQNGVTVREYRPVCSFITDNISALINQDVSLSVEVEDSNDEGEIAGVFFQTSDMILPQSTEGQKMFTIRFTAPGYKTVKSWAVDSDGFVSDTAILYVTITADKPWFTALDIDTETWINDTVNLVVQGMPGNKQDSVIEYYWDLNSDGIWDESTKSGLLQTFFTQPGTYAIKVGCRNSSGDSALVPASVNVAVYKGAPVINSVSCFPVFTLVGNAVSLTVNGKDSNGVIRKVAVKINGRPDSLFSINPDTIIDTSLTIQFQLPGKYLFSVAVIDDDNVKSEYVTADDSLIVTRGNPVVLGIRPDTCWIKDDTVYNVVASDVNGTLGGYFIRWEESDSYQQSADSLAWHNYQTAGWKKLSVYVVDNDNLASDTIADSVLVLLGKPEIFKPVFPDSVWYNDTVQYTVRGNDINGRVTQWAVAWESGQPFQLNNDSLFGHAYLTAGTKTVRMYVVDDDSISSDTLSVNVYVNLGLPAIASVTINKPLHGIYIMDSINFSVAGFDVNGNIDSIFLSFDEDTIFERKAKAVADSFQFTNKIYSQSDSGVKSVLFRVKDSDGLTTDSMISYIVRLGTPVIDSLTPHEVWVVDTNAFFLNASDTNGYIVKSWIDWNKNGIWDDSTTSMKTFYHSWDTTFGGGFATFYARVMDEDSLLSDVKTCSVFVKMGRPVLSGASLGDSIQWVEAVGSGLDTMFYRFRGGDFPIKVSATDSNGIILQYYWDLDLNGVNGEPTNTPEWIANSLLANTIREMRVYCKDDDSLRSLPLTFIVFPDSPPEITTISHGIAGDSVEIYWIGEDVKDGINTQYKIVLNDGAPPSDDDILIDFTRLKDSIITDASMDGYQLKYRFSIPANSPKHIYQYRVILQDERGSIVKSNIQTFSY